MVFGYRPRDVDEHKKTSKNVRLQFLQIAVPEILSLTIYIDIQIHTVF